MTKEWLVFQGKYWECEKIQHFLFRDKNKQTNKQKPQDTSAWLMIKDLPHMQSRCSNSTIALITERYRHDRPQGHWTKINWSARSVWTHVTGLLLCMKSGRESCGDLESKEQGLKISSDTSVLLTASFPMLESNGCFANCMFGHELMRFNLLTLTVIGI